MYADGVVGHAQLQAVGVREDAQSRGDQVAIDQRLRRSAADMDVTDSNALQPRHAVGDEAVGQCKGQSVQCRLHVDEVAFGLVFSRECCYRHAHIS